MADKKISQLTGASTPLAGTEVLPIVQSGSTVKVSVANLTAGRDTSVAKLNASDNVVIATAGKGVDFSANAHAAGMTSELLKWYEEGTWTPASTTLSLTVTAATYVRVGRLVLVAFDVTFPSNASGSAAGITTASLPFAPATASGVFSTGYTSYSDAIFGAVSGVGITFYNRAGNPASGLIESDLSTLRVIGACTYMV